MIRRRHILTTAALLAVCATPASAATYEDLRSPDAVDAAAHRGLYETDKGPQVLNREYGSPDAADAAAHRGLYETDKGPYTLNREYGSPDAVDAARDLPPAQIPAPVVEVKGSPASGFDWGDAGIGAAGILGLFSIAAGVGLLLTARKRRQGLRVAH
jgi:hypothetical protein